MALFFFWARARALHGVVISTAFFLSCWVLMGWDGLLQLELAAAGWVGVVEDGDNRD
jgi:hypothetical protein